MNRWLLAIPVIIAVAILAMRPATPGSTQKIFPDFRPDEVASIVITASGSHVTLTRSGDGWTVLERDHFPADASRVTQVLRQTWDLSPTQEIQARPSQLGRFQLTDPQTGPQTDPPAHRPATRILFLKKNEKPVADLLLGKRQTREGKDGMAGEVYGRFVRPTGHEGSVFLTEELFHEVLPSPMAWLDTGFPKIAQPQSFAYQSPTEQWTVVLEQGQWKLADAKKGEAINPDILYRLLTQWSAPAFLDVATASQPGDFSASASLTIHDQNGESVIYEIGKSDGAASPVKVHAGNSPGIDPRWRDRTFRVDARLIAAIPTTLQEMQAGGAQPPPTATPDTP
jgi:hypothetical protein